MIPLHLGALHPFEQALTLLLAFGPFVVLWIVVRRRRREDAQPGSEPSRDAVPGPHEHAPRSESPPRER